MSHPENDGQDELAEDNGGVTARLAAELAEVRKRMDARASGKHAVAKNVPPRPAPTESGTTRAARVVEEEEPPATVRAVAENLRKTRI